MIRANFERHGASSSKLSFTSMTAGIHLVGDETARTISTPSACKRLCEATAVMHLQMQVFSKQNIGTEKEWIVQPTT